MSGPFLIAGILILTAFTLWAQFMVKSKFAKYGRVAASSGLTGAQAALEMLRQEGITNVRVEQTSGHLSDHYDPRANVIRLSSDVYSGRTISAVGVACHEAGHAIQQARRYPFLVVRNLAVPLAGFGSQAGLLIIIASLVLNVMGLAIVGLVLFAAVALFQIVNLPVEFDASARAKDALVRYSIVRPGREAAGVSEVLDAAAMTYVAATLTSIFWVLHYAMIIFGNRR